MPVDIPRSDDPWNLRPYDVPWGHAYWKYKPGKLPGHDGDCLMLRSPTPIEQRRTAIACKHCRQRKAKCSGDQPACSRCAYSGRKCVYPDERRPQPAIHAPRPSKTARGILAKSFVRRASSPSGASSSTDYSEAPYEDVQTKQEDVDDAQPYLLYNMASDQLQAWSPPYASSSPRSDYSSPPSTTYCEVDFDPAGGQPLFFDYHEPIASTSAAAAAPSGAGIFAPRPVRPSAAADLAYPHPSLAPHVPVGAVRYSYEDPPARAAEAPAACALDPAGPISVAGAPQTFISITEAAALAAPSLAHPEAHCYASAPDAQPACYDAAAYGYAAQAQYPAPVEPQMQYASSWYPDDRTGYYVVDGIMYAAPYAEQPDAMVYPYGTAAV
ncbi:Zn(II)2Cys6 transcription factor domain-containing protein [Phanerochaete sordida]|uniref:Zn(II)2Cys6 transcription factor domain-containing protein n=1 Tax=Phanerochaete sordida TaxID=48140 RepID=A0A9P3LKB0_9APHY|nr:Zn(II)2Cys6 transcription factor domain-containing protein [Phanerochaete sordida]